MSDALEVRPRSGAEPAGEPLRLHPRGSPCIKDEPGTLIWIEPLADATAAAVKMYRRRSLLAWLRARRGHGRARREYEALRRLQRQNIPCTPPVFWATGRTPDDGRFEILATRLLPNATCLRDILRDEPASRATMDVTPLFRDVARMHRGGVYHGALIPRNILVTRPDGVLHIMDLPRSVIFPRDITGTRMARYDLMDLCAGLLRYCPFEACDRWLQAYGLDDGDARTLGAMARAFKSSKHQRNRLRGEFLLRSALARRPR